MDYAEHKTLDSLCRYMTDANGRNETWRVVESNGCLEIVADFPLDPDDTDDKRITGWVVTRGLDESAVLDNLAAGIACFPRSKLNIPPFPGGLELSIEELRLKLAAYGY